MNKNLTITIVVLLVVIGIFLLILKGSNSMQQSSSQNKDASVFKELIPVNTITHGHGLAVDVGDPNKLYIATHHGLLVLVNEKDLYAVGSSKDDYMGFSPHPKDAKVIFSSGHPETGGNIGFQKSVDGGFTWEKVSDGVNGPVDFHAMAVSPINPDLIFGWYQGALQRTTDGGRNWEIVSQTKVPIVALAADPEDENIIYAASPQGLMVSKDKGKSWSKLLDGFISTIAINPENSQQLLSYSEVQHFAKSSDRGKTWEQLSADFAGEIPLFTSFNKQNPNILYLLTEKNSIFKSTDGASSWKKIY